MKAYTLLAIVAVCAFALPVAAAHVVVHAPDPVTGQCTLYFIGRAETAPHASAWVSPCSPIFHTGALP